MQEESEIYWLTKTVCSWLAGTWIQTSNVLILRLIRTARFCGKLDTVQDYFEITPEVMWSSINSEKQLYWEESGDRKQQTMISSKTWTKLPINCVVLRGVWCRILVGKWVHYRTFVWGELELSGRFQNNKRTSLKICRRDRQEQQ